MRPIFPFSKGVQRRLRRHRISVTAGSSGRDELGFSACLLRSRSLLFVTLLFYSDHAKSLLLFPRQALEGDIKLAQFGPVVLLSRDFHLRHLIEIAGPAPAFQGPSSAAFRAIQAKGPSDVQCGR